MFGLYVLKLYYWKYYFCMKLCLIVWYEFVNQNKKQIGYNRNLHRHSLESLEEKISWSNNQT